MLLTVLIGALSFAACQAQRGRQPCDPGQYFDSAVAACRLCPLNTFSHGGSMTSCMPCTGDGFTLEEGAQHEWDCVCKAGFGRMIPFEPCSKCPVGRYNDGTGGPKDPRITPPDDLFCTACPKGYSTVQKGATSASDCTECADGTIKNETSGECKLCAKGTYFSFDGTPGTPGSCRSCEEGQTSPEGSIGPWMCHEECTPGQVYDRYRCRNCYIGTYAPTGEEEECIRCPNNTSTKSEKATSEADCTECEYGYVRRGTSCVGCPVGTYYEAGQCVDCPAGSTTRETGATGPFQCVCGPGHYRGYRNRWGPPSADCVPCAKGDYSDEVGAERCIGSCPVYMTTLSEGQTSSDACVCEAGTYMDIEYDACVVCGKGTYSEDGATSCTACPSRTTTNRTGAPSAELCECMPGLFRNPRNPTGGCRACPPNSYSERMGANICTMCPVGEAASVDRTKCVMTL